MSNKRRHFRIACFVSIGVLLGGCSTTPDTSTSPQATSTVSPQKQVTEKRVAVNIAPKPTYIPPKPIVVAVHQNPQPAVPRTNIRQRLTRPALPTVGLSTVANAPSIRPATVPVNTKRSVYVAPAVNNQQVQQRARAQRARQQRVAKLTSAALRKPIRNYSQSRLTGDFAGNPRAESFVRMMASRHGFKQSYVAGVLSRAEATPWLRKQAYKDANPAKRTKRRPGASWSNYRRRFITSKHINTGAAFYRRYQKSLQRAAAQYGVPEEYILGIMGVETIYGGNVGTDRAIDALATMSFMNSRRGNYFTSELESYFLMTRRARLDPLQPKASYAGALGLPQFMPSNIKKFGVDYDGDGAVNLWTPHDAIGSVANYLRSHGWKPGEIAAIPAVRTGGSRGYTNLKNGFKYKHSLSKLARNGLRPSYPGVSGMVNMVKLRTHRGNEYWVGGNNFYVITRYNHSSHYAMAVHQLAQEIRKRVKPRSNNMPRIIEASSSERNLLMQAANTLL